MIRFQDFEVVTLMNKKAYHSAEWKFLSKFGQKLLHISVLPVEIFQNLLTDHGARFNEIILVLKKHHQLGNVNNLCKITE